ncbi:hypothetical protein Hanom_Chr05g00397551 [Helianthus anomalus]
MELYQSLNMFSFGHLYNLSLASTFQLGLIHHVGNTNFSLCINYSPKIEGNFFSYFVHIGWIRRYDLEQLHTEIRQMVDYMSNW